MRFKDFLREARHRKDISVELAQELIQKHCSDMDINNPYWRGSKKASEEAYTIQGELGDRSSANTSNHYTVIMDEFLPKLGYPARSKSIICASPANISYARTYGTVYAIFPYNGVKIGITPEEDIWHTCFKMGGLDREMTLESWNNFLNDLRIPDYSYEDLVNGIKETLDEDDGYGGSWRVEDAQKIFGSSDNVEAVLRKAYSPQNMGLKLVTNKDRVAGDHEAWISGPCVAIRFDVWKKMTSYEGDDE